MKKKENEEEDNEDDKEDDDKDDDVIRSRSRASLISQSELMVLLFIVSHEFKEGISRTEKVDWWE